MKTIIDKRGMPIIAIDFDGTIAQETNDITKPGNPVDDAIDIINGLYQQGFYIIIWTCREGKNLSIAEKWLKEHKVSYDSINANTPWHLSMFEHDSRKIYADYYIDDKSFFGKLNWNNIKLFIYKDYLKKELDYIRKQEEYKSNQLKSVLSEEEFIAKREKLTQDILSKLKEPEPKIIEKIVEKTITVPEIKYVEIPVKEQIKEKSVEQQKEDPQVSTKTPDKNKINVQQTNDTLRRTLLKDLLKFDVSV